MSTDPIFAAVTAHINASNDFGVVEAGGAANRIAEEKIEDAFVNASMAVVTTEPTTLEGVGMLLRYAAMHDGEFFSFHNERGASGMCLLCDTVAAAVAKIAEARSRTG